jgi:hypothetical protein
MNKKYNQANQSTASVPKPVAKDSGGAGSSGQAKQDTVEVRCYLFYETDCIDSCQNSHGTGAILRVVSDPIRR